jgi:hypothetical protein
VRVVHIGASGRERSANPIFKGQVDYQTAVGEDVSRDLRLSEVHFKDGAVNKWHTHTCDQILIVTQGEGTVADEHEERDRDGRRRVHPGEHAALARREAREGHDPLVDPREREDHDRRIARENAAEKRKGRSTLAPALGGRTPAGIHAEEVLGCRIDPRAGTAARSAASSGGTHSRRVTPAPDVVARRQTRRSLRLKTLR